MFIVITVTSGHCQKTHTVFYEGSDNELHVYRVYGRVPGKTLLLIGGIQGDEPGSFLSADLYADISLAKGNLIVVPRANFPSILQQKRKINEDMNRKFADDHVVNYEAEVVQVLKQLIHESDCLLNLHEGSGFYSPTWENSFKNPARYGQSIIADTHLFEDRDKKIFIDLQGMAEKVIEKVNSQIKDPEHYFHFNNHKTSKEDSIHKEQRKSATYFALYSCAIPAFGIESAKSLPLIQKVSQHVYAINAFMELFDIVPETPGLDLRKPELQYMVVSVNGAVPVVVESGHRLEIKSGDIVEVIDVKANYSRGLSVDIIGVGAGLNDMRKKLSISHETRIEAKKDFFPCGSIYLDFVPDSMAQKHVAKVSPPPEKQGVLEYIVKVNSEVRVVENYGHITFEIGDELIIEDIRNVPVPSECIVNFKGFVGNRQANTGEDRGFVIPMNPEILMKKYSIDKQGYHYYVETVCQGKEIGRLFLDINH